MTRDWHQILDHAVDDVHLDPHVYDEARRAHRRHRGIVLSGAATSVLAVGALTAALLVPAADRPSAPESIGSPPASTDAPGSRSTAPATGRDLLLAAASVAATRPAATGRYWHVVSTVSPRGEQTSRLETWTSTNGDLYLAYRGHASPKGGTPGGFEVSGIGFVQTTRELAALPTDPAALVAHLDRIWDREQGATGRPAAERDTDVQVSLISLLADVPTPPAVRAAAFRALADSPNVDQKASSGTTVVLTGFGVPDSKTARPVTPESDRLSLTVDPATSALTRTVSYSDTTTYLLAQWTDTLP